MKKKTALALVLVGALISEGVAEDDKKHIEPREARDATAKHLWRDKMGVRLKPVMRPILWTTHNGVQGEPFAWEGSYSANEHFQIIRHTNRGTEYVERYQFRRITGGVCAEWTGSFDSSEEAYQQAA